MQVPDQERVMFFSSTAKLSNAYSSSHLSPLLAGLVQMPRWLLQCWAEELSLVKNNPSFSVGSFLVPQAASSPTYTHKSSTKKKQGQKPLQ